MSVANFIHGCVIYLYEIKISPTDLLSILSREPLNLLLQTFADRFILPHRCSLRYSFSKLYELIERNFKSYWKFVYFYICRNQSLRKRGWAQGARASLEMMKFSF